ncbi:uncharacterized protein TNCV_4131201 [Trichonephila clavipes]|nr:uncharacterized protein TNCV_4131201 [Trichonephila clavipes]
MRCRKLWVQMLNEGEIVTSVQEEFDAVDDEMDEDEDSNNNESSKGPSNADAFSVLETAMDVWFHILHGSHSGFEYPNNRVSERCPVPIDLDKGFIYLLYQ